MITLSCSQCSGTIARDIELTASSPTEIVFKMAMKCPHCKALNRVEISTAIVRSIRINGRSLEAGVGEPREDTIRTL
jgi:phage FluMu protein Com